MKEKDKKLIEKQQELNKTQKKLVDSIARDTSVITLGDDYELYEYFFDKEQEEKKQKE